MATLSQWIGEGRIVPTTNLIDPIDGRVIQAQFAPALIGSFQGGAVTAPPIAPNPYANGPGPNVAIGQTPIQVNIHNQPVYGYPRHDLTGYGTPPKSKVTAMLLAFFLGAIGIHRFYLGHSGTGIAMLLLTVLTCGYGGIITGIWALIDLVLIATDALRESNGRALA
jgi:TM2 domain-containing membrane protein YozV